MSAAVTVGKEDRERTLRAIAETLLASGQYSGSQLQETATVFERKVFNEAKSAEDYFSKIDKKLAKVRELSAPKAPSNPAPAAGAGPGAPSHPNQSPVRVADAEMPKPDVVQWFSKNRLSIEKILKARAAFEDLQIDGVDVPVLLSTMSRLLNSGSPAAEDISVVRAQLKIAMPVIASKFGGKKSSQTHRLPEASHSSAMKEGDAVDRSCSITESTEYLARLLEKSGDFIVTRSKLKQELVSESKLAVDSRNDSVVYKLARSIGVMMEMIFAVRELSSSQCLSFDLPKEAIKTFIQNSSVLQREELLHLTKSPSDVELLISTLVVAHLDPTALAACLAAGCDLIKQFNSLPGCDMILGRYQKGDLNSKLLWTSSVDRFSQLSLCSHGRTSQVALGTGSALDFLCDNFCRSIQSVLAFVKNLSRRATDTTMVIPSPALCEPGSSLLRYSSNNSGLQWSKEIEDRYLNSLLWSGCGSVKRRRLNSESHERHLISFRSTPEVLHDTELYHELTSADLAEFLHPHKLKWKIAYQHVADSETKCPSVLMASLQVSDLRSFAINICCDNKGSPIKASCFKDIEAPGCGGSSTLFEDFETEEVLKTLLFKMRSGILSDFSNKTDRILKENLLGPELRKLFNSWVDVVLA